MSGLLTVNPETFEKIWAIVTETDNEGTVVSDGEVNFYMENRSIT